jgi:hypothetical protein
MNFILLKLCEKPNFLPNQKNELLKELHTINLIIFKKLYSSKKAYLSNCQIVKLSNYAR